MTSSAFVIDLKNLNEPQWFNWQQPALPLLLGGCVEAVSSPFSQRFGIPFFTSMIYFRMDLKSNVPLGSWLLRFEEGKATGAILVDLLQDAKFASQVELSFRQTSALLESRAIEISALSKKELSNLEMLPGLSTDFFDTFRNFYAIGCITEPIQWRVQQIVETDVNGTSLEDSLFSIVGDEALPDVLYTPREELYASDAEKSLVECAKLAESIGIPQETGHVFESLIALYDTSEVFRKKITSHQESYFWVRNNYGSVRRITDQDIIREVADIVISDMKDLETGQSAKFWRSQSTRNKRLDLRKKVQLAMPLGLKNAVDIGDRFGSGMADARKRTMLIALDAVDCLASALSNVIGQPKELITWMMPAELEQVFSAPDELAARLKERQESGIALTQSIGPIDSREFHSLSSLETPIGEFKPVPKPSGLGFYDGDRFRKIIPGYIDRIRLLRGEVSNSGTLQGQVAYKGDLNAVSGIARVVVDPHNAEIAADEILIATSTTPDFMHLIRKAKAIVTDQKGMTTHAALTSREMKIPCIVGTSVASLHISSGERIELNLETGEVVVD